MEKSLAHQILVPRAGEIQNTVSRDFESPQWSFLRIATAAQSLVFLRDIKVLSSLYAPVIRKMRLYSGFMKL
jgi:hypothetical protein